MKITKSQRITILDLWHKVCRDRRWKEGDRALRLQTFSQLLGRQLPSTDDIGRIEECTKVMNGLRAMIGVSVRAGLELVEPDRNEARVIRFHILNDLTPCLAVYVEDVWSFIVAIMEDKNRWWKIDRPVRDITLEDLDAKKIVRNVKGELKEFTSTLEQLQYTLQARLNEKRKAAGHTIHEMKMLANVPCSCAICRKAKAPQVSVQFSEASPTVATSVDTVGDPDWKV